MSLRTKQARFVVAAIAVFFCGPGLLAQGPVTIKGALPDGALYVIEVPSNWNGTLFLYSHGYTIPGTPNPAQDFAIADPLTHDAMLANGFALAGSSYAHTGWAVQEALVDQIAVLDAFNQKVRKPDRTIAWGHSLGGMITAGLIQRNPGRFDAALPMCGVLSGGVATWNTALDSTFGFQNLIPGGSGIQLVNITNPNNLVAAEAILAAAQATPKGRARIALGAALGDLPGWFDPASPQPGATDFSAQEANQFQWDAHVDFPFVFAFRAELEARAGGNPSSNVGVDYRRQFAHSVDAAEVRALYEEAGLDLETDLNTINQAPRISADTGAREYLEQNIIYDGDINIPVLTMHTTGDGLVVVENESAYRQVVREDGNQALLRRTFVSRAGHCTFTPAETIAAVQVLIDRLDEGKWRDLDPAALNAAAAALGPLNTLGAGSIPPAFVDFHPAQYLRPFDGEAEECEIGHSCRALASLFRSH